jgi:Flp pilus assembly protein TadG
MSAASSKNGFTGLLTRLARDRAGNTVAMIAAALIPLLALVGGGIDMGRSYLSQTRLQQACDAGVLAARKKLGATLVTGSALPADVETVGQRYFNINFGEGAYGTIERSFTMTRTGGDAISGTATVAVPTTIMAIFGDAEVGLTANCEARLNFANTDIMFVLDTTGSMSWTNSGDSSSRLEVLKKTVLDFTTEIDRNKTEGTRVRYGFVPYSTNVNVGYLLKSDWMVDNWSYNGRSPAPGGVPAQTFTTTYTDVSGSYNYFPEYFSTTCPTRTDVYEEQATGTNPDGSSYGGWRVNGTYYWCNRTADGSGYRVSGITYNDYVYTWLTSPSGMGTTMQWTYQKMPFDVSFLKSSDGDSTIVGGTMDIAMFGDPSSPRTETISFQGCIEERSTYEIDDFNSVDLSRAYDLDIDLVPTAGNPDTQWRPMFHEISFEPEIWWDGTGSFKTPVSTGNDYLMAGWGGYSACPARSQKLEEMTVEQVDQYLGTLVANGSTYHDIGMIWGGRLISPTGIFATENADVDGRATSRHLIFLTDGETSPLDISYGTYGIEPLDKRRWSEISAMSLTEVIENRFSYVCRQVKSRNVTVWVIGFGTTLNPIMTECAGSGHYFEANNASELSEVFSKIAASMGDLRISK